MSNLRRLDPSLQCEGTRIGAESLSFPIEGVDRGSISVLAVQAD